jgi:AraC family transcriptional regulator
MTLSFVKTRSILSTSGLGQRIELLDRVAFDDPVAARIMELLSREDAIIDASSRLFVEQAIDLLCIRSW